MTRKCKERGCDREHYALGKCRRHYAAARARAAGVPKATERGPGPVKRCTVDGCRRERRANGFCGYHLLRWQRYGDPCEPRRKGDAWTPRENELLLALSTRGQSGRAKPGSLAQLALELGRSKHVAHVQRSRLLRERDY